MFLASKIINPEPYKVLRVEAVLLMKYTSWENMDFLQTAQTLSLFCSWAATCMVISGFKCSANVIQKHFQE